MNELETKRIVVNRIISHLNPVPANAVNELFQQTLPDLEVILDRLATTRDQEQVEEATLAHVQKSILQSKADHAWAFALARVTLNGKVLVECAANREVLEGMLQPHEESSPAIYETILKQYSPQFSWASPQSKPTKEDQRAAFDAFVRENSLSSVEANFNLFKEGASVEHYAGASGIERAQYANEAAQARQKFLINHATPSELRAEAKYQSATEREMFVKAEADRQHQYVLSQQQQSGLYSPLPATMAETGEVIDAKFLRKLSTVNLPMFKAMCRKYGSGALAARLRGE